MYSVMTAISGPILLLMATLSVSAQTFLEPDLLPTAHFHHEILYQNDGSQWAGLNNAAGLLNAAGNAFLRPAITAAGLFTPNTVQQPAETPGQIENYRKALEEEAREADKAENEITGDSVGNSFGIRNGPKSYVSVKVGGDKHYNYGYTV